MNIQGNQRDVSVEFRSRRLSSRDTCVKIGVQTVGHPCQALKAWVVRLRDSYLALSDTPHLRLISQTPL
jgi:hypothetical protein